MVELFDYQREMRGRIEGALLTHQAVMAQMPTGTGKTVLLASVVKGFLERLPRRVVWIVAHRRELVEQIKGTLGRVLGNGDAVSGSLEENGIRVMSVQWLSRHYKEMKEEPGMIVIDEAHHALAETYAEVMDAFPEAKKLGLTATPCRLNGKGFGDLFDVLLTSWSIERFIAEGRLSVYDYYSIRPDSADQLAIGSLQRRGADGDYVLTELSERLDVRPSIERLYQTVREYVPEKKGVVYAISIEHAEHIADYYREHGIKAVAISSNTPDDVRGELIDGFRKGEEIRVLVSVDLFSEGFDCPDVEFVQLARPTLSLTKYLQMVGRGLRVAEGKGYCVVLDNVGLYKRFGLPSAQHDWQRLFEGREEVADEWRKASVMLYSRMGEMDCLTSCGSCEGEMMRIVRHEELVRKGHSYRVCTNEQGLKGVKDEAGKWVLECRYREVELHEDGWAYCRKQSADRWLWADLKSGLHFHKRPQTAVLMGIEFCTEDGKRLFPRICSPIINEHSWLTVKTLEMQVGSGLAWKQRFIPWNEPGKVYRLADELRNSGLRLYQDDEGRSYVQAGGDQPLRMVSNQSEVDGCYAQWMRTNQEWLDAWRAVGVRRMNLLAYTDAERERCFEVVTDLGDGLYYIRRRVGLLREGEAREFWLDSMTKTIHYVKPQKLERGFVRLLREGDVFFVRNIRCMAGVPLRGWQVRADGNICVIDDRLFLKDRPRNSYRVLRRSDDFSYFLVAPNDDSGDTHVNHNLQITQYRDGEVKLNWVECVR